jgi:hypothetical protein
MKNLVKNVISKVIPLLCFVVLLVGCKDDEISNVSAGTLLIDQPEVILEPGDSIKLTATVMPDNAGNKAVFWKTSSAHIASITGDGWVKAGRPGKATVTAIAYSNAEIRNSISVTVNGTPDDVMSGVVGTYTGDLTGLVSASNIELSLTQEEGNFYSVRLITSVPMGPGNTVPINILTSVDRDGDGDGYRIFTEEAKSVEGLPWPISVNGTVDADGNITLAINNEDGIVVTYTGKNTMNITEIITGTYVGNITMDGVGPIGSNIEIIIAQVDNKYQLQIDATVMEHLLTTNIEIAVLRSNDVYTISSNQGTSTLGPITVSSGTITTDGGITFNLEIPGLAAIPGVPSTVVTYTGQKLENLAKAVAGTYEGRVSLGASGNYISAPGATVTLTAVDRTTVRWTTATPVEIPGMGAFDFSVTEAFNFLLTVGGGSGTYTLTGTGNTSLGSITVSEGSVEDKSISLTMTSGQIPVPIIYEGEKP